MKRILSLLLLAFLVGSIKAQSCDNQVNTNIQSANAAIPDSYFQGAQSGQAITFNNVQVANTANNYNFINNGITSTDGGNNLYLNGIIQPKEGSGGNYNVRLAFTKTDQPKDVKKELTDSAYTTGGVDPSTWSFYQVDSANSVLTGFGAADGNTIQLLPNPDTALQVGKGASGKNIQNGLSGWFLMNVTNPNNPNANMVTSNMDVLDINVNLGCQSEFNCLEYTLETAIINPALTAQTNQNQALFVGSGANGFFNSVTQWDLAPNTANTLTLNADNGNAHILLNLYPQGTTYNSSNSLVCSLNYVPTAAPAMPKEELDQSQYVQQGGPINPLSWVFYNINGDDSSCTYNGNTLTGLGLQDNMPMQLGTGASGKNNNFGLASWISFNGGYFDINLDAKCGVPDTSKLTTSSTSLSSSTTSSTSISSSTTSSFLTLYSTITSSSPLTITSTTTNLMTNQPCPLNSSTLSFTSSSSSSPSISTSSITTSSITSSSSSISTITTSSSISTSSKTTDLGSSSPPTETPTIPVETCPPGCQPIPLPTENPVTETPAGNDATNVEISKLFVAVLSLFILAFFH